MKVFIIATITADGFIGKDAGHLADWSSKEDKKFFVKMTKQAGVMVMGRSTFETIGRALSGRRTIVYTTRELDVEGVETTQLPPRELLKQLADEGYDEVAICGGQAIYDMFLAAGAVDVLHLTISPLLFGSGLTLAKSDMTQQLSLQDVSKLNDDTLLVTYEVKS